MNIAMKIEDTFFFNDNNIYENCSVKELHKICEYYEIRKIKKYKKMELINLIISFEEDDNNNYIVSKRRIMWTLMEELNNDSQMKKYILWN
jgi:hypothetical protein